MADWQRIEDSEKALKKAIQDSSEVLVQASTVFSLSKTQVVLNRPKLVIEKRSPLGARDVVSFRIEDVVNVTAAAGPVFGTIKIITKSNGAETTRSIGLFRRGDAIRLKRTIQGYVIAREKKIDLDVLPTAELRILLNELGTDDHTVK